MISGNRRGEILISTWIHNISPRRVAEVPFIQISRSVLARALLFLFTSFLFTSFLLPTHHRSIAYADHLNSAPLHWSHSAWLGAGYYQVGQAEVFHVTAPSAIPVYTRGDVSYQLSTGLALGLAGFKLSELSPPQELSTLSLAPGLQIAYNVTPHWQLKPFVHGGIGFSFTDKSKSTYLISVGLKNVYRRSIYGLKTSFGNRLLFAKYHETKWSDDTLAILSHGVDVKLPLSFSVGAAPLDLNLCLIHDLFTPQLPSRLTKLSWTMKVGFHIGHVKPVRLKLRLGLYYVDGDERLKGVRINMGFPF